MNLGQNRARSKRLAGKGTSQWEELYDEVRAFFGRRLSASPKGVGGFDLAPFHDPVEV